MRVKNGERDEKMQRMRVKHRERERWKEIVRLKKVGNESETRKKSEI